MARITRTGSRGASAPRIVRRAEARRLQASEPPGGSAVLFSGGLDSAVLLAAERHDHALVWPIHVRSGLAWEEAEAHSIGVLLAGPPFAGRVQPLTTIGLDMRDVYAETHWARAGRAPAYDTPDEAVYIEGRNIVLVAKAAVLCATLGAGRLVLGPLAGNPFPDATPAFFDAIGRAVSLGLDRSLDVVAPFAALHKEDVIALGRTLGVPLERTLSCMSPVAAGHCGQCSKCRERQQAFSAAGVADETSYARRR
jgi:7-cyano-7-deazaguanine synthase